MNKLIVIFTFCFLLVSIPLLAQSDDTSKEESGGIYPTEAQGSDTNEITPDRGALGKFSGKIEAPKVSKDLQITSQTQNETRPNYYVLEGYVDLVYQGTRLQADRAEFDAVTKDLIATGNVVLDQENQHLTGDRLELNLETKKGNMYNARGFVPPQIFFWGKRLEKLGEEEYKLYDGVFTECSQIVPHWHLNATTARMTINEYIHFKNFLVKAKSIPMFYSPYMMWPIHRERATGFLFPAFGPNNRKGFYVGNSFFWAMGKSMDSTYWLDHYADRGFGGGVEYRYAASKESDGTFKSYYMDDKLLGPEYTIEGNMRQELPWDFDLKAVVDYYSSYDYIREYANSVQRSASQTRAAQGFLTRSWSYYTFNFLNNYSERESNSNSSNFWYHLPEFEFQGRSQKLGPTPFFWTLLSSFDYLARGTRRPAGDVTNELQRYDLFPSISFPITYLSWLTLTPTYGHRVTYYTKSENEAGQVVDEPLTRKYSDVTLDLRGPNFSKIFDTPSAAYSQKWKHAIEPQIVFHYLQDIPERDQVFQVDQDLDFIAGQKVVTYSITNLLYAKRPVTDEREYRPDEYQFYNPPPVEPPVDSAWELISWRLSQSYNLDSDLFNPDLNPNLKRLSPIASSLRINPAVNSSIQFDTGYDVNFKQWTGFRLQSTLKGRSGWFSNLSYTYSKSPQTHNTVSHSINGASRIGLWNSRVVLNGKIEYNVLTKQVLGGGLGVIYNDDCFSIGINFRQIGEPYRINGKEHQITFYLSLPNIGNLVSFDNGAPPRRY